MQATGKDIRAGASLLLVRQRHSCALHVRLKNGARPVMGPKRQGYVCSMLVRVLEGGQWTNELRVYVGIAEDSRREC